MNDLPRIVPLGEAGVTIVLGDRIDDGLNRQAAALAGRIRAARLDGVTECVAAWATVAVYYDPLHLDFDAVRARLDELSAFPPASAPVVAPREHVIPTRYDGPDLEFVAGAVGLSTDEVVSRHADRAYRVCLLGFAPGFAYLGPLDPALDVPRRVAPRSRVPAGSVAIASGQTAIYPLETPGGWHLIGRTEVEVFDPTREPPALFVPGDLVRFERAS